MDLRTLAENNLSFTLEGFFSWPVTVTDPDGNQAELRCQTGDIGLSIDINTGQPVSGRLAHVALRISSIESSGLSGLPRGQADKTKNPWKFVFDDINGHPYTFTVKEAMPDRTLGIMTCILELLKNG